MLSKAFCACAPAFAALVMVPAGAAQAGAAHRTTLAQPGSVVVSYRDLDLSSEAGAHALVRRVHAAAETICGPSPFAADIARVQLFKGCIREARDHALAAVHKPMVAALLSGDAPLILALEDLRP